MDPTRRDKRRVPLLQINTIHLVNHIPKPSLFLLLARAGPLLVRGEVGGCRADEEEGLAAAEDVVEDGRAGEVDVPVLRECDNCES